MTKHEVKLNFDGKEYSLETGRFAKFADGAVMVRCGDTMVLVTVVASKVEREDIDFLPLQVEYREKIASAGKIPGGFLKREGRPSDREVLVSRLIDRPIRPMMPKSWRCETQIIATVYSAEPEINPDTLSAVGASAALMISDIPFNGPISQVCVGRIEGQFVVNPSYEQLKFSDMDISVSGTDNAIMMVEGESAEISEDDFLAALEFAHNKIKELNELQKQLCTLSSKPKREYTVTEIPEEFVNCIKNEIYDELVAYVHKITSKAERSETRTMLFDKALTKAQEMFAENEDYTDKIEPYTNEIVSKLEKQEMRNMILSESKRLDGRGLTDIRDIFCEVGLLPRTHGSALFTRGETQSLTTLTLGTSRDEQMIDGIMPLYNERFMLHYNFPPFCTGETGRVMGVSRREVGHGNLAWRALKGMLPEQEGFPYTLRLVSDILESNGSSSMATVCAGTLALFDAGVPMKKPVAGIAMGLIKEEENFAVLSDILGDEDFLGDMDFKVTGTFDGITACQMDIKIEGISFEIMKTALEQARQGRYHILGFMKDAIEEPRPELSLFAPRFTSIKVPQENIGLIIGPGGENIRSITKESNTEININDDGTVMIAAVNQIDAQKAIDMIRQLIRKPEEGDIYNATVKEIREGLGAFMEILPKTQGLLHISQISYDRFENVSDVLKVGEKVEVKLLEITPDGKFRLSRKALLPKPENYVEPPPRSSKPVTSTNDRGRNDRGRDRDRNRRR